TDGSEAGNSVDLVQVDAPAGLFQKEIDTRHSPALQATERTHRVFLETPHLRFRKLCWNFQPRAFFQIFGGIVVEFSMRNNLARNRSLRFVVSEHGHFDFPATDIALD